MVLLDPVAYCDVVESDFLRSSFGRVKCKSADSSVAGSYSTLGLAGENTLVELFGATMPGPVSLSGGLVFSFELPGSAAAARRLLDAESGVGSHYELVLRSVPDSPERQPWYHLLRPDLGKASPLVLMLNEVTPEYFAALGASPGPAGEMRRGAYLDATLGSRPGEGHCLHDITGVSLRLCAESARRIAAVLATLGFTTEVRADETVVTGSGVTIALRTDESGAEGVTSITMALTRGPHRSTALRFGATSELVLDPSGVARWSFTPLGEDR